MKEKEGISSHTPLHIDKHTQRGEKHVKEYNKL